MAEIDKLREIRIGPIRNNVQKCRILYDIPCKVCQDHSSGKHYGIFACDGCAGFFKRSIRRNRQYVCKSKIDGGCLVDKTHRNQCRACRLFKCVQAGMNKEAVQHERGPRNSTIRRQMSLYFKDSSVDPITPPRVNAPSSTPSVLTLPSHQLKSPTITENSYPLPFPISTTSSLSSISFPFSFSPFNSPLDLKLRSPRISCLPITSLSSDPNSPVPHTNLSPPPQFDLTPPFTHPDLAAIALNRIQSLTTRSPFLLAPIPKYPHEVLRPNNSTEDSLCESAARMLFMSIRWAKSLPAFNTLPLSDQITLIEEGWRELFILSATQFLLPLEAGPLLSIAGLNRESTERILPYLKDISHLQEIALKFKSMSVDHTEFACLKAIVLFKTVIDKDVGDAKTLQDIRIIAALQDQAQVTLNKYISSAYPSQPFRFGKLLLLLPLLKSVASKSLEKLFFKRTIGQISMERIIADMVQTPDII